MIRAHAEVRSLQVKPGGLGTLFVIEGVAVVRVIEPEAQPGVFTEFMAPVADQGQRVVAGV